MNSLPSSIETSLKEAGFSDTEILTIRRLVQDGSMTLRQLASKTGKSTGVLDQATKKLIKRKIVIKQLINDSPMFSLVSLESVTQAIERDMHEKQDQMLRKFNDFESFVSSLKFEKNHPGVEMFHGTDGMKKAYCKLLSAGEELIGYVPALEDVDYKDPLEEFRVELFRERKRRNIFSRIITHNTPRGRRYHTRDPFEFRATRFIEPATSAFDFEKLIIGDMFACFDAGNTQAFLIKQKQLAATERALFEALWIESGKETVKSTTGEEVTPAPFIPVKTRAISTVREFFTSKQSLLFIGLFAAFAASLTLLFYQRSVSVNTERIRDRVQAIAATSALQFDANDIAEVHTKDDVNKPAYKRLVEQLNAIREHNDDVEFAYIMRPTEVEHLFTFVADADSMDVDQVEDLNEDGVIDEKDTTIVPGDTYDGTGQVALIKGIEESSAEPKPVSDQWGTFLSGHAPIYNQAGAAVAIVGIDMLASEIYEMSNWIRFPFATFLLIFSLLLLIRWFSVFSR